jgi:hypothetical protein
MIIRSENTYFAGLNTDRKITKNKTVFVLIIFTILSPHNLYYNNKHKMLKYGLRGLTQCGVNSVFWELGHVGQLVIRR